MNEPLTQTEEREKKMIDQSCTIVKRDGRLVFFRMERIKAALTAAFQDTKKQISLAQQWQIAIARVTEVVCNKVMAASTKGQMLTVEDVQDLVEITLMEEGHHDVARDYILYREHHKTLREDSPCQLRILRKDGMHSVKFNPMRIASTLERGFRKCYHVQGVTSTSILESVERLTQNVVENAMCTSKSASLTEEMIQDMIEKSLMEHKFFDVAKNFILNRQQYSWQFERTIEETTEPTGEQFLVKRKNDKSFKLSKKKIERKIAFACKGYEDVTDAKQLTEETVRNFYEEMQEEEVDLAMIMAARAKVETEPSYSYVAAHLLLDKIYRETMKIEAHDPKLNDHMRTYFKSAISKAVSLGRLSADLLSFNLDVLAEALCPERDLNFSFLGLQTVYDRYLIHDQGRRLETPQIFWMRIAMGLSLREKTDREKWAKIFYDTLSQFLYVSSTPTLFNAGTCHSQLSSCYLSTVMDDLGHIYKVISDDAQLSKWAGGIGNDWTNVRATGATIKGTNGKSQGIIPFLKVANDTAVAVNQCFDPTTLIYTAAGIKPISKVVKGDLVLGQSGTYRTVTETFLYNQKDEMVTIRPKFSLSSLKVTAGHPFYVIQGIPEEQAIDRTLNLLKKGKVQCQWVEAAKLKKDDYIAQVIPKEVVPVEGFEEEDARLYGILLGDGHLSKEGYQWEVSGNPQNDSHLEFVRSYLRARDIHFWETAQGESYQQIHWAAGRGALRDGTTGRIVDTKGASLPFDREDIYNECGQKHISPRFSHLPHSQAVVILQGVIETNGCVSRGKEITFSNTSQALVEGVRYQLLRLGIASAGQLRERNDSHSDKRSDGSFTTFEGKSQAYDLRIPAFTQLAKKLGIPSISKRGYFVYNGCLFSRIKKVESTKVSTFVCDMKVEGDESYMTVSGLAHNGGKRKGAMCAYLETWHLDLEDFLELRKNTGDERRRTHDMNTANWIPDLFMKRVIEQKQWTLFSPDDVSDLHHLYGKEFEKRYEEYEKLTEEGKISLFKKVDALTLWRRMLGMLFETGHPWITFKDPSNIRAQQDHAGVIHSSNLCTEILLNTSEEETAVCNLGSINLAAHTSAAGIDENLLANTVEIAIRMLDNVIDINYYPTKEARTSNSRHRPIGLGLMGFQDALYKLDLSYASKEAIEFSDRSMEMISYYAILSSSNLAKERGCYSSFKGSKWDRGLLPIDSLQLLKEQRGEEYIEFDTSSTMDWQVVRDSIQKYGMRNSHTMAIAPTATIANIAGVTASIEPMYKHLFVKSNLSGEFTIVNSFLVEDLKKRGLWNADILDDLKYYDGALSEIASIPEELRKKYLTAFEIDPDWIIACASRRQKWIDMGQSLNLYLANPSGKKLNEMYLSAWKRGLKTTYYLRSTSATQIEKSTTDINKRGFQPRWMKNSSASSRVKLDRDQPTVCNLEEGCESCQ